jgi:glutathione S-transferase
MLLAAEAGIALDFELVDLFSGAHLQPEYCAINPSKQVPLLEDGDFRLSEASAILKYLADTVDSPTYPRDLRRRARVNERMDWFNTGLYRDLGYGLIYPQCLPHHKRPDAQVQSAVLAWGRDKSSQWLDILDASIIGPNAYVCGDAVTIADFLGACYLTLGEVTRLDYSRWLNVSRWLTAIKARPSWAKVNEGFYAHFVAPYKDAQFAGF